LFENESTASHKKRNMKFQSSQYK